MLKFEVLPSVTLASCPKAAIATAVDLDLSERLTHLAGEVLTI